jgi:ADP-heptose:LPS heptosyltransferase
MQKEQHLLVIRLSAMGDVAMLVPVVIALTQKYPNLRLRILTKAMFTVFFEDIPNVDVQIADTRGKHKSLPGILRLATEIPNRIDAIADVHNVLRSKILRRVLSMRGLKNEKIRKGRKSKKALTRTTNKVFKQLKTSHQRYADVFSRLGYPVALSKQNTKAKEDIGEHVKNEIQFSSTDQLLGFAPFAAHRSKRLSLEKTKLILKTLQKKAPHLKVVLFGGGEKEVEDLANLSSEFQNSFSAA